MITTKQRAFLRAQSNGLEAILQVGKNGINDNLIKQVNDALEARELIKITVLNTAPLEPREVCDALCTACGAQPVSTVGWKIVLYRESTENKKIYLS